MNHTPKPPGTTDAEAEVRQSLSAAADGDPVAMDRASQLWRSSADARSTWHRYHLIGDVMRSAELARTPTHDADFLATFRSRMALEPVLLAPTPEPVVALARQRGAPRWMAPAAVAAGLMVVAGVLVVSRLSGPVEATGGVVATGQLPDGLRQVSNGALSSANRPAAGTLIRDARLDEYLRAHQAARGGLAAALPGNALRQVDAEGPEGVKQ